jgi:hypothetical protein
MASPVLPLRVFGHYLPADLTEAVARDTRVPLLGENWFVAGVVWGVTIAVLTFVLFGSVFFAGAPQSDPAAARVVLIVSVLVGLISGFAGLGVHRRLRSNQQHTPRNLSPELHRAVALHRLMAAGLLLLLGLSGLWHAWLFAPLTRALGVLAFGSALGLGFLALPAALALFTGQSRGFTHAARMLDRALLLGIGLVAALIAVPPVANAQPGAVFLGLTQALSLLALPWVAAMMAAARIHSLYATYGR